MLRCVDCNSLMTKEEKVCVECGSRVAEEKRSPAELFVKVVTILFYLSFAGMIGGIFLPNGPSFTTSLLLTCGLLILMRTVKDIPQRVRKR